MKRLEADRLLVSRIHAGATMAPIDVAEMRGVFLARQTVETLVAQLAAERMDDTRLAELEDTRQAMRDALGVGTLEKMAELNSRFHRTLAQSAGHRVMHDLTEQLLLTIAATASPYRRSAGTGAPRSPSTT
ncbi:FCD domain-containing protein [Streptomyces sp. BE303]|nr:FCD domain-containing protein [Streptomyces sp. BE303]MED7952416.1 FCD domain-containing protein [Streptomyces sp. BE303]